MVLENRSYKALPNIIAETQKVHLATMVTTWYWSKNVFFKKKILKKSFLFYKNYF